MKAIVVEIFQDKITKNHYAVGDVINIDDSARLNDLIDKNLVKVEDEQPKASRRKK